jgi:hypothetical protein
MVLDLATVLGSIFGALRATRSGCSLRGRGRAGSDGFLILSLVTLEEGDAGWWRTTVPDESPCSTSRLVRTGGIRSGGGRAGRGGFLIPSRVTLTLEEGDVGRPTKVTLLDEGCATADSGFELL